MVPVTLIEELDDASLEIPGITKVPERIAASYIQRLAEIYVGDPSRLWWWEALKVPSDHLHYGDTDGLEKLASLVVTSGTSLLIVTDDNPPPWPLYSGEADKLLKMLTNVRFF